MSTRVPQHPGTAEVAGDQTATVARPPAVGPGPGTGIVLHPDRARLVFAVVAFAVVAAIVAAIIVLAGGRAEPFTATKRLPVTAPGAALAAPGFAQLRAPAQSQSGSLTSLIRKRVGVYSLRSSKPSGDLLGAGAVDAYDLKYTRAGGATIYHTIAAFGSAKDASSLRVAIVKDLVKKGVPKLLTKRFNGGVVLTVFRVDKGVDGLVWSDGSVYADAFGPSKDMPDFFSRLPY